MPLLLYFYTFCIHPARAWIFLGWSLLFLLLNPFGARAQQPSYQVVGGDFLEGKDVYSLLEGEDKQLWIGTDEGLFVYDGEQFKGYTNPEIKNSSVFSLCSNSRGDIFYVNFSGQIMRVIEDSLEVYYELPDSLLGLGIDIEIDDQEEVIVFCKALVNIDEDRQHHIIYQFDDYAFSGLLAKQPDKSIVTVLGHDNNIATWQAGKLSIAPFLIQENHTRAVVHPEFSYNGKELILMNRAGDFFLEKKGDYWYQVLIPREDKKILGYAFTKSRDIWLSQRDRGVFRYAVEDVKLQTVRLFPDYMVSHYLEDSEGNLWLGTFKKGLLRIPHLETEDFRNNAFLNANTPIAICAGAGDTLYAINDKDLVYQIDGENKVTTVLKQESKLSTYLQYVPWTNCLYLDEIYYHLPSKTKQPLKTVFVKSLQLIPPNNLFFTDYTGSYIYSSDEQAATLQKEIEQYSQFNKEKVKERGFLGISLGRINAAHYQAYSERFWIANTKQLVVMEQGDSSWLTYKNRPIVATQLASWKDTTYVATNNELLKFVGTTCQGPLTMKNAPLLTKIYKMEQEQNLLYLTGVGGFQCVNLTTQTVQTLDVSDGLLSNKVLNFALLEHYIVLLTSKGLQKITYALLEQPMVGLEVELGALYINGQLIETDRDGQFKYFENELEVVLKVPYLRDRANLTYSYRLLGLGEEWHELPASQNRILYNSLRSGSYSLEVQAKDKKRFEVPLTRYSFVIAPPFWETWWFVTACLLLVVLLVSLFFWVRIRILKKQNALLLDKKAIENQLVESQQTALRSQMNPHFLFNALNSIQEMIIVNDKNAASNYLGKFADLMRLYLNHSREESITLAEELEALQLYLELEQVRFEESLSITLKVAPDLFTEELTLPPMLIQPYVENAFKHGLLHKSSNRQLYIEFKIDQENQQLCCLIKDNGVGRARSAQIKKAQIIHHSSFASSATQRRLELLNYNKKKLITATIKDLTDATGKGIGTAVNLCIPLDWEE